MFGRDPYVAWTREEARALGSAADYAKQIATLAVQPTISILTAIQDPHLPWLEESLASVVAQLYPDWELWLCAAGSSPAVQASLERYQALDARIKLVPPSVLADPTATLNRALNLATGEFLGLLEQHDTLAPQALYEIVLGLQDHPVDIFYSDEDTIDASGQRGAPFFKPDWSPDLCLSSLYACHFGVYRRSLVETVGGLRPTHAESVEYDLLLRCTEQTKRIVHIPRVLYHKRQVRSAFEHRVPLPAHLSAKQALSEALGRRGEVAEVEDGPAPCTFRVRRRVRGTPLVSIIIPIRDRVRMLRRCLESIETHTTYQRYEILIVDNGSEKPKTLMYLASLPYRVIRDNGSFNFARLNNHAATQASGEHLLFLNNDVAVLTPEWLEALLEHSQRREVGAVGAQLLYADDTLQHAGVVLGMRGVAGHAHKYLLATSTGYFFFPHLIRNYSAVTAACLMTRKAVYEEVGGMEERLAVMFNDVDLCLRLHSRGYLVVYTPYARLYHHESRSRWYRPPRDEEVQYMLDQWGPLLAQDPYYNPHLALSREDFSFDLDRARAFLQASAASSPCSRRN
jgi:GT2 family glycosyltransferase